MATVSEKEFFFCLSCDVQFPLRIKIEQLIKPKSKDKSIISPLIEDEDIISGSNAVLYVECVLAMDGVSFGAPVQSRYVSPDGNFCWDEWLTLAAKICDLTADAHLCLTVWDAADPWKEVAVGGCTIPLFSKKRELKSGRFKLRIWDGQVADCGIPTCTPGKLPKGERGEMERCERLRNKYERGDIPPVEWLDSLTFRAMDRLAAEEEQKRNRCPFVFLWVELPAFEHSIVFQEMGFHAMSAAMNLPPPRLVIVQDDELQQKVNPAEHKLLKLSRGSQRTAADKDLKPNSLEKKEIQSILTKPPTIPLLPRERELLWKFRFSLTANKRALTKFLKCVDWSDAQERQQSFELMHKWAAIDIADALELLSQEFNKEEVREFAVLVLSRATDKELLLYLLQLVQALRFERCDVSPLATLLVSRASTHIQLASSLHWLLLVEWQDTAFSPRYSFVHQHFVQTLLKQEEGEQMYDSLHRQNVLCARLAEMVAGLKTVRGGSSKKVEKLRETLRHPQEGLSSVFSPQNPLPLPLNPAVNLTGVLLEECFVFKSVLNPIKVQFQTEDGCGCSVIFKKGDDLRQDQLIIQMVQLMDSLLKKENLDLRLTPYRVLATGPDDGLVEFVPSTALATVLEKHRTIVRFLSQFHGDEEGPYGISMECLDTFVKSCAGYCVAMYILGVGDRHLDNLMLCEDGRLFHIDFGFILGRDPKPFPPPMKLCKEMVEAMGGMESAHYIRFKSYCCEAYNILRKSSNLIINLFHLMAGSSIPDIANDPQKGVVKVQQKLRLDLDDEAAVQFFQSLINESVSALFPQMVETIHRWAQYWR